MAKFDAVIVGGGHNGLVAAAYLAREGMRVALFEKRDVVGGFCVTEERFPGYKICTAAYSAGLLRPEVISDLRLAEFGYEAHAFEPQFFMPFPNGKYMLVWTDMERNLKEMEKFSKRDAKSFDKYVQFWTDVMELVEATLLTPPPPMRDLVAMFEGTEAEDLLRDLLFRSAGDLLDEYFESEEVKASMVAASTIGLPAGPRTPGTCLLLGHMLLHEINGMKQTFGYVKGGMGAMTQAIAKSAERFGVEIHVGRTVQRIVMKDGAAAGVELDNGKKVESKLVLSCLDPKTTFLKLVGRTHLDKAFATKVEKIRSSGVVAKVNCALSELPDFTVLPGKSVGPQHGGYIDVCPSVDYLEKAWDDSKYGRPSSEPFLDCVLHSVTDPSLAPPGKHTISIFAQYMPTKLSKGSWEDIREEVGDRIMETLAQFAPNLRGAVLHREVWTPVDLEKEFGSPSGCIYQIDMTPDQLFSFRPVPGWSSYRTPVKGLYLCGSSTHPGGGVTGAPGRNAALTAFSDMKGISM